MNVNCMNVLKHSLSLKRSDIITEVSADTMYVFKRFATEFSHLDSFFVSNSQLTTVRFASYSVCEFSQIDIFLCQTRNLQLSDSQVTACV
jgi:hypothetical protein